MIHYYMCHDLITFVARNEETGTETTPLCRVAAGSIAAHAPAVGPAHPRGCCSRQRHLRGVRQPPAAQRSPDSLYPDADGLCALPVLLVPISRGRGRDTCCRRLSHHPDAPHKYGTLSVASTKPSFFTRSSL